MAKMDKLLVGEEEDNKTLAWHCPDCGNYFYQVKLQEPNIGIENLPTLDISGRDSNGEDFHTINDTFQMSNYQISRPETIPKHNCSKQRKTLVRLSGILLRLMGDSFGQHCTEYGENNARVLRRCPSR